MSVKVEKNTVLETVSLLLLAAVRETADARYRPGLPSLTVGLEVARADVLNLLPAGHSFAESSQHLAEIGERSVLDLLEGAWTLVSELPVEPGLTELVVEISDLLREARDVGPRQAF